VSFSTDAGQGWPPAPPPGGTGLLLAVQQHVRPVRTLHVGRRG
jgi:hypothetical protein